MRDSETDRNLSLTCITTLEPLDVRLFAIQSSRHSMPKFTHIRIFGTLVRLNQSRSL